MIQQKLLTKKQQVDSTATSKLSSAEKEDFAMKHSIHVNSQDTKLKSQVKFQSKLTSPRLDKYNYSADKTYRR